MLVHLAFVYFVPRCVCTFFVLVYCVSYVFGCVCASVSVCTYTYLIHRGSFFVFADPDDTIMLNVNKRSKYRTELKEFS